MTADEGTAEKKRLKRRRHRAKRKAREAAELKAGNTPPTKPKTKRKPAGALSLATLPGAPMRVPEALKEGRRVHSNTPTSKRKAAKKPSAPASKPVVEPKKPSVLAIDHQIAMLPRRSMLELRRQWLNVLRLRAAGKTKSLVKFQDALTAEWERRHQSAVDDPDHFEWPSTDADDGDGGLNGTGWYAEGLLGYLGYRVGATQGLDDRSRKQILDLVFGSPLPPINGPAYMREWAMPGSSARLRKIAEALASFTRNAKRKRGASMESAIADWERDLSYLFDTYYIGKFGFAWPSLSI